MDQDALPLSWSRTLLSIIPGLLATVGLITTDFSVGMLVGLGFLVIFLASAYRWNHRRLPGWGLMAMGMLASVSLMLASGVVGGLAAIIAGKSASTFVLLVLLTTLVTLSLSLRTQRVPVLVWVLLVLIILCQLAVRVKYFALFGVSWSVASQWLSISLYAAVSALLIPVALGRFVAQRYGLLAMLFVIGMIFVGFQILIDVNYKVSDQMGGSVGFVAYKALIPVLFTVIAPLWFLRARSALSRIGGMLTLVGSAVITDLLVVGFSYAGELPLVIWISFIPYTVSVLLTFVLAYLLYRESGKHSTQVAG